MPQYIDNTLMFEDDDLIMVWNEFCMENRWENEFYTNDEDGLYMLFNGSDTALQDLARAIHFGEYNYMDTYVVLNGYGNLESFSENNAREYIDESELVAWFNDNENNDVVASLIKKYDLETNEEE